MKKNWKLRAAALLMSGVMILGSISEVLAETLPETEEISAEEIMMDDDVTEKSAEEEISSYVQETVPEGGSGSGKGITIEEGKWGKNLHYRITQTGTDEEDRPYYLLEIMGTGEMADELSWSHKTGSFPWREEWDQVREIVLGEGITSIAHHAFADMANLRKIHMPKSLKKIEDQALQGNMHLSGKLLLPYGLEKIGAYAFEECESLSGELMIPDSVKIIGDSAFKFCNFKGTLKLSKNLQIIGRDAFLGNGFSGSLRFPHTVKTIGNRAFSGCRGIEKVYFEGNLPQIITSDTYEPRDMAFYGITADAYYPSWWTSVPADGPFHGGTFTWHKNGSDKPSPTPTPNPSTVKVTFDKNSKSASLSVNSKNVKINGTYGTMPEPKLKNNVFVGWYFAKTGGKRVKEDAKVTKTWDHKLYAHWKKGGYITYKLNGGKNHKENKGTYYSSAGMKLKSPVRDGYTFGGWYTDSKFRSKITEIKKNTYGNRTLYAKWNKIPYFYINYEGNKNTGGSVSATKVQQGKTAKVAINKFSRKGYTFRGWNTRADGKGKSYKTGTELKNFRKSITLYAQWRPNEYTVSFNGNGADSGSMNSIKATYDKSFNLPDNGFKFKKHGYKFKGWARSKNGKLAYTNKKRTKNINHERNGKTTLYAQWEYRVEYRANIDNASGKVNSARFLKYHKDNHLAMNGFSVPGYKFLGWCENPTGTGRLYQEGAEIPSDFKQPNAKGTVLLYAKWERCAAKERLQNKFPTGKYWNHVAGANHPSQYCTQGCNNPDGVTEQPCASHSAAAKPGQYDCNTYVGAGGQTASQCMGFAFKLGMDAYGSDPYSWATTTSLNSIKPGDILTYHGPETDNAQYGHTAMVVEVNGNNLALAECNAYIQDYASKGCNCLIHWGRIIHKNEIWNCTVRIAPDNLNYVS